jgi:diguanylate cyclase (GGDEF)-like protein
MPLGTLPEISRAPFIQALGGFVEQARSDQAHVGLMLIDLANLSSINHYHGYSTGDTVLLTAHQQLLGLSKLPDTVFRVGDHRFAFILPGLGNPAFIALATNKVHTVLEEELEVDEQMLKTELKVGIAVNRLGERDAQAMLVSAESSLSMARLGGHRRVEELLGEDDASHVDYRLEQRFAEALQDNDFDLYYQPKIDLATGSVGGAEALLRWFPDWRDPVPPEVVVSLADSAGKAYELTKWIVHHGLRQMKEWQSSLDVGLALNVQAELVGNPDLPSLLKDAIAIWGVEPGKVTVEITESGIIEDKESGFNSLVNIKDLGFNLSIDDFGTGYSSLSYFKHIPANELKIDRTFVGTMMQDQQDLELVKIMINIAHQFGLTVVAEGIEDVESLNTLRDLGCDYGQGYYFSKPLSREDFEVWVNDWPGLPERN